MVLNVIVVNLLLYIGMEFLIDIFIGFELYLDKWLYVGFL